MTRKGTVIPTRFAKGITSWLVGIWTYS